MRLRRWKRVICRGARRGRNPAAVLLAGCSLLTGPKQLRQNAPQVMTVTSPLFRAGCNPSAIHLPWPRRQPGHLLVHAPRPEPVRWPWLWTMRTRRSRRTFTGSCSISGPPRPTFRRAASCLPERARQIIAAASQDMTHPARFTVAIATDSRLHISTELHLGNGASAQKRRGPRLAERYCQRAVDCDSRGLNGQDFRLA